MFESTDDLNLDEEFLNDAFELESNKRQRDDQPVERPCKKPCSTPTPSTSKEITNILSIIKPPISVGRRRVVQRKFPGPAGILPEQKQSNLTNKDLENIENSVENNKSDEILCSQLTDDIFNKGTWNRMIADCNQSNLPFKYTIEWMKSNAVCKKLIGQRTPFLAAIIQNVDCSSKDPMVLLKDKTGEIHATIIHEVWEEYCDLLHPGAVIVLKQVGVLSTTKKHYLTVTLNNLLTIYSQPENSDVQITKTQSLTIKELLHEIETVKQKYITQRNSIKPPMNVDKNPFFKTSSPPVVNNFVNNLLNRNKSPQVERTKENDSQTSEEEEILSQVLEGVDTQLLFEDF